MSRSLACLLLASMLGACGMSVTATARAPAQSVVASGETYHIPHGHMPPPGACRPWFPGEPPGHQPPSGDCDELRRSAPRGALLLYRPSRERRVVRIR